MYRCDISILCRIAREYGKGDRNILRSIEYMGIHNRPTTHHLVTIYLGNPTSEKTQKMTTLLIIFTLLLNLSYENSALSADFRDCETEFNAKKYETAARVREQ